MATEISLGDSYDSYGDVEERFQARLDDSLSPRGPDSLFDLVDSLDLPESGSVLDVGCGTGRASVQLARRFGLTVLGIDPLEGQIERARRAAHEAGLAERATFRQGAAEELPVGTASFDFIWCKEALMFTDLPAAMSEFSRVLRPGGVGLAYQVLTGPRMSEAEAAEFWPLGGPARSIRPEDMEAAIAGAGLQVRERVDYGSEWGEFGQETSGSAGRRILHAARLLRDPGRYVDEFGEKAYTIMLGDCLWHVYRMIGKLHGVAFIFEKTRH